MFKAITNTFTNFSFPSAVSLSCPTDSPELKELKTNLKIWVDKNPQEEDRKTVANRIEEAYASSEPTLDLCNLHVSDLPSYCISSLPFLQDILFSGNSKIALPTGVASLKEFNIWFENTDCKQADFTNAHDVSFFCTNRNENNFKNLNLFLIESLWILSNPQMWQDARNRREVDLFLIQQGLQYWKENPSSKGDVDEAEKRILSVFNHYQSFLDLSHLSLTSLPSCLARVRWLEELIVSSNAIQFIPFEFAELKNLEKLNATHNQLSTLPPELKNWTKLILLKLHNNQFTEIPNAIMNMKELTILQLGSNTITTVPDNINQLQKLKYLSLSSNQIHVLPNSLAQLTELLFFDISNNYLARLPSWIDKLRNLMQLILDTNVIDSIPENIVNLSFLKNLSIENNRIKRIPESINKLLSLEKLYLSNNQLSRLPDSIGDLTQLNFLSIDGNSKLINLPESFFRLSNLTCCNVEKTAFSNETKSKVAEFVKKNISKNSSKEPSAPSIYDWIVSQTNPNSSIALPSENHWLLYQSLN